MYGVKQITVDKDTADKVAKFMAFEKYNNNDDFVNEQSLYRRIERAKCRLKKHITLPMRASILSVLKKDCH